MNYIGIDPSIKSTGITINGKVFNMVSENDVYGKKTMKKWYRYGESVISYNFIDYHKSVECYQTDEINKLIDYDNNTDKIIELIKNNINDDETIIGIESYSYNSAVGDIIDLVTFSATLRLKLYKISKNLIIIPPSSLKKYAASMTYSGEKKGKNIVYRNHEGLAGGFFQKREMFLSLVDNVGIDDEYVNYLRTIKDDLLSVGSFPKPFDDCNDSFIIYKYLKTL